MLHHQFYVQDDKIQKVRFFKPHSGIEIYEVIRIINGIPIFSEDHLKRFFHSAWVCHLEIPLTAIEITNRIRNLVVANNVFEGNIRFSYCFRPHGSFQAYFIPHQYPDNEMIKHGVSCDILFAERTEPNAKVVQVSLREQANKLIAENNLYEVLLVNQFENITEGSRSNVFFVKDCVFVTAPEKDILPGITRLKVLELLQQLGEKVEDRPVQLDEMWKMDAIFLTGTSPKVLPVRCVGNQNYEVNHPSVQRLIAAYNDMIFNYLTANFRG